MGCLPDIILKICFAAVESHRYSSPQGLIYCGKPLSIHGILWYFIIQWSVYLGQSINWKKLTIKSQLINGPLKVITYILGNHAYGQQWMWYTEMAADILLDQRQASPFNPWPVICSTVWRTDILLGLKKNFSICDQSIVWWRVKACTFNGHCRFQGFCG